MISPIHTILTEGRKFNIGLNYSSQFTTSRATLRNQMLNNTALTVYFKPDEVSVNMISKRLHLDQDKIALMSMFNTGECFIKGSVYNFRKGNNENALIFGKVIKQTEYNQQNISSAEK